jgi:hypothetical protein
VNPPAVRITINKDEYGALEPGLDLLANRLATARLGSFPNRHAWHRIDFLASNVYRDRAYDESTDQKVIEVRAKLLGLSSSRRIYVDFSDAAILAFALRQLRKTDQALSKAVSHDTVQALARKLEKYRKRAKRKAISAIGKQSYDDTATRWRSFSSWMQYNLLWSKVPRRGTPFIKKSWRDKKVRMAELINVTVSERYDRVLTEAQVNRIRDLVIPSLRRGRHELTLNTVLAGSDAAKDFLVAFITKRLSLEKGTNAPRTRWEGYWERAAILAEAAKRPARNTIPSRPLPSNNKDVSCSSSPVHIVIPPPAMEPVSQPSILLTDQQIIIAVCRWFADNIHPSFHREIFEQARSQILSYPSHYVRAMVSTSLVDLIQEARPTIESDQSVESCDYTNGHVEWLLGWMLALRSDVSFIWKAIGCGYGLATRQAA